MAIAEVKELKAEFKGTLTSLFQRVSRVEARLAELEKPLPTAPIKPERAAPVAATQNTPSASPARDKETV